jgi:protein phosphatase
LGVTATDKLRIHSTAGGWDRNQSFLLCSDGLLDGCDTAFLHQVLGNTEISAQEAVEQMLFHALQGNADNNITAVLLRLN